MKSKQSADMVAVLCDDDNTKYLFHKINAKRNEGKKEMFEVWRTIVYATAVVVYMAA